MRGSPACPALKVPKAPALSLWKFVMLGCATEPEATSSSKKFTRLKTLKNSARNWSLQRSVKVKLLESPMSQEYLPGIRKEFLPTLPNVPARAGLTITLPGLAGSGTKRGPTKAAGLSQLTQFDVVPHVVLP